MTRAARAAPGEASVGKTKVRYETMGGKKDEDPLACTSLQRERDTVEKHAIACG